MGIHHHDRSYETAKNGLEDKKVSKKNKQLILNFINDLILENIAKPRLLNYIHCIKNFAEEIEKDLDKLTIEDLKQYIGELQQNNKYSILTKQARKIMIRRFYKWLKTTQNYPDIASWINISVSRSERRLPADGDLLTEEDVKKLIKIAKHPRNKALISILWESGARVSEIGNLNLSNVVFDKHGILLTVKGKTGSRKIRLIFSTPYLATWINAHPFNDQKNMPLWLNIGLNNSSKQITYGTINDLLKNVFKQANIKKRSNPHIFRHSRATYMANHLTEFQMNQYFGWVQGSNMPATYVHMSGKEVEHAILEMNGIQTEEKQQHTKLQPRICPRCDTINQHDSQHCGKCGGILDLKYAMEIEEKNENELNMRKESDEMMNLLLKDQEVQQVLLKKLKELKGGITNSLF